MIHKSNKTGLFIDITLLQITIWLDFVPGALCRFNTCNISVALQAWAMR